MSVRYEENGMPEWSNNNNNNTHANAFLDRPTRELLTRIKQTWCAKHFELAPGLFGFFRRAELKMEKREAWKRSVLYMPASSSHFVMLITLPMLLERISWTAVMVWMCTIVLWCVCVCLPFTLAAPFFWKTIQKIDVPLRRTSLKYKCKNEFELLSFCEGFCAYLQSWWQDEARALI